VAAAPTHPRKVACLASEPQWGSNSRSSCCFAAGARTLTQGPLASAIVHDRVDGSVVVVALE